MILDARQIQSNFNELSELWKRNSFIDSLFEHFHRTFDALIITVNIVLLECGQKRVRVQIPLVMDIHENESLFWVDSPHCFPHFMQVEMLFSSHFQYLNDQSAGLSLKWVLNLSNAVLEVCFMVLNQWPHLIGVIKA